MLALEWPAVDGHSGGVGRYSYRLAEQLRDEFQLTVVTGPNPRPLDGVALVSSGSLRGRVNRYYVAPIRVANVVKQLNPDVIISHGDDWSIPERTPLIRIFHGSALREAQSSSGIRALNHYVLSALESWSARKSSYRIAVGLESLNLFSCDQIIPPFWPVDCETGSKSSGPSAVFVGSFHGRKRGHLAQEAWSGVRKRWPDAQLTVFGPAEDKAYWEPWVTHVSGAPDHQVQRVMGESWILLAPSSYEGFGIPSAEALCAGTAVLATPNPGATFIAEQLAFPKALIIKPDQDYRESLVRFIEEAAVAGLPAVESGRFADTFRRMGDAKQLVPIIHNSVHA
ncbi:glycosyltransferase family 4 protein [Nocardioides bruguierae]|uniref:glycosyltransferase family 4 protein n=1 Tax=Nocardioides bruguierae TaxID=2945102 RepID=UPI003555DFBD